MTLKPDFTTMTTTELRAYLLAHRNEEAALHAYLDRLHAENPNPQTYDPEEDVAEVLAAYLKQHDLA